MKRKVLTLWERYELFLTAITILFAIFVFGPMRLGLMLGVILFLVIFLGSIPVIVILAGTRCVKDKS